MGNHGCVALSVPPGGLRDGQVRPRTAQLVGASDWYVVEEGRFDFVGRGEVSEADLLAVGREIPGGVFVCVRQPKPLEEVLGERRIGTRRLRLAARMRRAPAPRLRWVARGARVAVLPGGRLVFVDGEHLFKEGEKVPLPWTSPAVSLVVLRPRALYRVMREVAGRDGPKVAGTIFKP
jgi:hypothetical protein